MTVEEEQMPVEIGVNEPSTNAGWADAMTKVLAKQVGKDDADKVILAKTKIIDEEVDESEEKKKRRKRLVKKRKWENLNYVRPNVLEKDHEKQLQKVSTRGVIQLFNTVKKHQKEVQDKLQSAKTEGKKEKVLQSVDKGKFLDMLNDKKSKNSKTKEVTEDKEPQWKVLRDDYMLGNNMKDWDRKSDDDETEKL